MSKRKAPSATDLVKIGNVRVPSDWQPFGGFGAYDEYDEVTYFPFVFASLRDACSLIRRVTACTTCVVKTCVRLSGRCSSICSTRTRFCPASSSVSDFLHVRLVVHQLNYAAAA